MLEYCDSVFQSDLCFSKQSLLYTVSLVQITSIWKPVGGKAFRKLIVRKVNREPILCNWVTCLYCTREGKPLWVGFPPRNKLALKPLLFLSIQDTRQVFLMQRLVNFSDRTQQLNLLSNLFIFTHREKQGCY